MDVIKLFAPTVIPREHINFNGGLNLAECANVALWLHRLDPHPRDRGTRFLPKLIIGSWELILGSNFGWTFSDDELEEITRGKLLDISALPPRYKFSDLERVDLCCLVLRHIISQECRLHIDAIGSRDRPRVCFTLDTVSSGLCKTSPGPAGHCRSTGVCHALPEPIASRHNATGRSHSRPPWLFSTYKL